MRCIPGVALGLLVFALQANAQQPPYRAVVADVEVKLRAGPSSELPETGVLARGSVVTVERDDGSGWLAISAPSGSVSWIAATFVEDPTPEQPTPKRGFVHSEGEVTLATGKAGLAQPLDIRREKIPQGTIVLLIGPKVDFNGKKWYPIAPPPGDVRYVPKTALQFEKPLNNAATVRVNETITPANNNTPPVVAIPGAGTPAGGGFTAGKPAVNHPLWAQAETAEREGRLADAEKLYFDLAAIMNAEGKDHDLANLCYTRIHTIRDKRRNASGSGTASGTTPNVLQPPAKDDRGVRPGTPQPLPPAAGTNTNNNIATEGKAGWNTGTLRRSSITPDGPNRPVYALETAPGVVKMYVSAAPGIDLEKYIGKRVDVYGSPTTRTGLSKPFTVATAVELSP
jgi:hypothetical protein